METTKGKIETATKRNAKMADGTPFEVLDVVIAGQKYSADKSLFFLTEKIGQWVEVQYETTAKGYKRIKTCAPIETPKNNPPEEKRPGRDTTGRSIEAQVCIKAAAEMTAGALINGQLQAQTSGIFFTTKCEEAWEWLRSKDNG